MPSGACQSLLKRNYELLTKLFFYSKNLPSRLISLTRSVAASFVSNGMTGFMDFSFVVGFLVLFNPEVVPFCDNVEDGPGSELSLVDVEVMVIEDSAGSVLSLAVVEVVAFEVVLDLHVWTIF